MKRFTNLMLSYFWSLILLLFFSLPSTSYSAPTLLTYMCYNITQSGPDTQYLTNLNILFKSLSSNANSSTTGYYTTSVGDGTNDAAVYGFYLCRGDQNATSCASCVQTATTVDLPHKYCRSRDMALIWYHECMVRYTSDSSSLSYNPGDFRKYEPDNQNFAGNQTLFINTLAGMMLGLVSQAISNDDDASRKKNYATKVAKLSGSDATMLYGLGQCKPDLTSVDCGDCLMQQRSNFKANAYGYALQGSCFLEFATYPFFNDINNDLTSIQTTHSGKTKISAQKMAIIGIVVPLAIISAALFALRMRYLGRKKAKELNSFTIESGSDFMTIESLQYDLNTLKNATNKFSNENKLGVGGFGVVYKGTLKDGQEIAVKRLSKTSARIVEEFKNEVLLVAKLQHKNLVKLFGFCLEGTEKLLVYEYVPHKSLDHFLFDPKKQSQLSWEMRYQIIGGIARGMLYLHQGAWYPIVHRDLKASNILLDGDMNSKIADFGMARMFDVDQTQAKTCNVAGTFGYMAPEYTMQGQYSIKSDVYSFGVLILEIICGKKINMFYQLGHENLMSYAWKQWINETPLEFVDPTIRDSCSINEVTRCLQLGLLCVQHSKEMRPLMATIVHQLESDSTTLSVPEQPFSYGATVMIDQPTTRPMPRLTNDVTITEIEPR